MKGFGTVVTGTLISGTIHKDHEVQLHPVARGCDAGVQVHGTRPIMPSGQRTALNLAGVETTELARGMMLTPPQMFQPRSASALRSIFCAQPSHCAIAPACTSMFSRLRPSPRSACLAQSSCNRVSPDWPPSSSTILSCSCLATALSSGNFLRHHHRRRKSARCRGTAAAHQS